MSRTDKISKGKIFQVYWDANPDYILFEGGRSKCLEWLKIHHWTDYRENRIRIGQLLWENGPKEYVEK